MRRILLAAMILALTVASADARRRGHRHHGHHSYDYVVQPNGSAAMVPGMSEPPRSRSRSARSRSRRSFGDPADAVPTSWTLQAPDPNWSGKRFVSPDGAAWFALYATPVDHEPISAHMKTVAFADGEEITGLLGRAGWLAVSGRKGDRLFYRKAVLACDGKVWRHIAFEYPADARRRMDRFVAHAAAALDGDERCDEVSSR